LPLPVLEQIRILSNLETDKEKLLQIILVGQLNLQTLLRSPGMRQLDQRVSIRYELKALDAEAAAAYVAHRLTIAGGHAAVSFSAKALRQVHRWSGGIPRLINLICDRSLLAAYSVRANRISPEMVTHAAHSLDVQVPHRNPFRWLTRQASLVAAAAVVLMSSSVAVGASAYVYQRFMAADRSVAASAHQTAAAVPPATDTRVTQIAHTTTLAVSRELPAEAAFTILVSSFPIAADTTPTDISSTTDWLEASGFRVFYSEVDLGLHGRWRRVLAGAYVDSLTARRDAQRLRAAAPHIDAHLVSAGFAIGLVVAPSADDTVLGSSGTEP
jgi:hypothetical protein